MRLLLTVCAFLSFFFLAQPASSAELSKSDAAKLLASMGDANVVVAAIVNQVGVMPGTGPLSGPNVAMVIGYAERDGRPKRIEQTFFYDKDIGWFYHEIELDNKKVRLWTISGYKEVRPQR